MYKHFVFYKIDINLDIEMMVKLVECWVPPINEFSESSIVSSVRRYGSLKRKVKDEKLLRLMFKCANLERRIKIIFCFLFASLSSFVLKKMYILLISHIIKIYVSKRWLLDIAFEPLILLQRCTQAMSFNYARGAQRNYCVQHNSWGANNTINSSKCKEEEAKLTSK